ncbi:hypothetical protein WMY93_025934 [Mugilogobius chulae]|uniref:Uncharacterized protein n=1 Tax=Mugilogobius chulae TaxID=88201 RepID=A0AAW0N0J9_9GOBI
MPPILIINVKRPRYTTSPPATTTWLQPPHARSHRCHPLDLWICPVTALELPRHMLGTGISRTCTPLHASESRFIPRCLTAWTALTHCFLVLPAVIRMLFSQFDPFPAYSALPRCRALGDSFTHRATSAMTLAPAVGWISGPCTRGLTRCGGCSCRNPWLAPGRLFGSEFSVQLSHHSPPFLFFFGSPPLTTAHAPAFPLPYSLPRPRAIPSSSCHSQTLGSPWHRGSSYTTPVGSAASAAVPPRVSHIAPPYVGVASIAPWTTPAASLQARLCFHCCALILHLPVAVVHPGHVTQLCAVTSIHSSSPARRSAHMDHHTLHIHSLHAAGGALAPARPNCPSVHPAFVQPHVGWRPSQSQSLLPAFGLVQSIHPPGRTAYMLPAVLPRTTSCRSAVFPPCSHPTGATSLHLWHEPCAGLPGLAGGPAYPHHGLASTPSPPRLLRHIRAGTLAADSSSLHGPVTFFAPLSTVSPIGPGAHPLPHSLPLDGCCCAVCLGHVPSPAVFRSHPLTCRLQTLFHGPCLSQRPSHHTPQSTPPAFSLFPPRYRRLSASHSPLRNCPPATPAAFSTRRTVFSVWPPTFSQLSHVGSLCSFSLDSLPTRGLPDFFPPPRRDGGERDFVLQLRIQNRRQNEINADLGKTTSPPQKTEDDKSEALRLSDDGASLKLPPGGVNAEAAKVITCCFSLCVFV